MKTYRTFQLITLFAATLIAPCASALEIVFSEHRDTHSFQRISEYLTGHENPGRYVIARTDPDLRDGFYIAIKVEKTDPADSYSSARIQFVKTASQEIHTADLELSGPIKKRLLIGLTGEEWAPKDVRPQAWKIELLDNSGQVVDSVQSFLWSLEN